MRKWTWITLTLVSVGLIVLASLGWLSLSLTEVLGFVTGAACVLLVVEQNLWNFPVGIANELFFIALFYHARLYGDMTLQFVYLALSLHGWYVWLHGGEKRNSLRVSLTPLREALLLVMLGTAATLWMRSYLTSINDAAPLLDALTTVLSLIAQYLLNKKRLGNWPVWIAADVIYVYLYAHRKLYLTAVLYAVFIGMCVAGLRAWRQELQPKPVEPDPAAAGSPTP